MTHLIITRVNLWMRLCPHKYSETELWKREGWNTERIELLNSYARKSLAKQTNQNFTYITLWQDGHRNSKGKLDGEVQIEIQRTGTRDDEPLDYKNLTKNTLNYADQIRGMIRQLFKPPVLVTNLDCDDALRYDFVENLQNIAKDHNGEEFYWSTPTRYCYNIKTGAKGKKISNNPSPFVSTWEPEIQCLPLRYNHSWLNRYVDGKNIDGLYGVQTVNETNMFSKGTGKSAKFNLSDYV